MAKQYKLTNLSSINGINDGNPGQADLHREEIDSLLEGIVLPDQFADLRRTSRIKTGEQRLALALLNDARKCLLRVIPPGKSQFRRRLLKEREQALEWVLGSTDCLTFDLVCEGLGVDPDQMRDSLIDQLSKIIQIERNMNPLDSPETGGSKKKPTNQIIPTQATTEVGPFSAQPCESSQLDLFQGN